MIEEFDTPCSKELIDSFRKMDDDAKVAFMKLTRLIAKIPKGTPMPSKDDLTLFVEKARLEKIRHRLGGTVGIILPFPTQKKQWLSSHK